MDEPTSGTTIEHVHFVASRPVWGVIGALFVMIGAGFSFWLNTVQADQTETRAAVKALEQHRTGDVVRLERLESNIGHLVETTGRIERAVDKVSDKIDHQQQRNGG